MISKENMKYSLKNLWKRKARSFLTLLSIFIGITTIFIFVSFGWGLYDYIDEFASGTSADKITIQGKGGAAPGTSDVIFTDDDLEAIEKTKGVTEVTAIYFDAAQVKQDKKGVYVYFMGMDFTSDALMELFGGIGMEKGRDLKPGEKGKVVLGYNYMIPDKIFPKGYNIGDKIEINGKNYDIVGFYESIGNPADDSNIYTTLEQFEQNNPGVTYDWIIGRASINEIDETIESVKKNLRKLRGEEEGKETFDVISYQAMIEAYTGAMGIVIGFVILIALISVVVSAVNTANTMITSVLERIKEIGVIKSIGAKNSEIFNIFLFESSFLGFVAGVIGVLLGFVITALIGGVLDAAGWGFLSPHQSWIIFLGGIAFATIVGGISGVAPAINASKLKPVDALRYE